MNRVRALPTDRLGAQLEKQQATFEILDTSIICFVCGMTSYNLQDVANRFCGYCHRFHDEMTTQRVTPDEPEGPYLHVLVIENWAAQTQSLEFLHSRKMTEEEFTACFRNAVQEAERLGGIKNPKILDLYPEIERQLFAQGFTLSPQRPLGATIWIGERYRVDEWLRTLGSPEP